MPYLDFYQFPTIESIRGEYEKRLKIAKRDLEQIAVVFEMVERHNGKQITKRFTNDFQKHPAMQGKSVRLTMLAGMYHVEIEDETGYHNRMSVLIGYDTNPFIDLKKIKEYNICFTNNKERIPKIEEGLKKLPSIYKKWQKGMAILKEANKEAKKYEMGFSFDLCALK